MHDPLPSLPSPWTAHVETAFAAGQLSLANVEQLTALSLAHIRKNAEYVQRQLDAARQLQDPSNVLQFFQEQFEAGQTQTRDVAEALFELSQEFYAQLTALAHNHCEARQDEVAQWLEERLQALPAGSQAAIAVLRQALALSRDSVDAARQAARESGALAQRTLAQWGATAPQARKA